MSGTGKELFAQAIHKVSSRRPFPFVRINCAAMRRELFESELFGYEKGAFTGARSVGKPGKFEPAHHASLFLDEIGDMPMEMQPKLLRVLEEKEFERVGRMKIVKADFRLLSVTNHSLDQMLEEKSLLRDLFYRLNVVALHIPKLREPGEDILPIARLTLQRAAQDARFLEVSMDVKVEEIFLEYDWQGNCRELINVLERAISEMESDILCVINLPPYLYRKRKKPAPPQHPSLKLVQGSAEREAILQALESSAYNKARTDELLGIHRSLLYKKMKKYKLPLNREKAGGVVSHSLTAPPPYSRKRTGRGERRVNEVQHVAKGVEATEHLEVIQQSVVADAFLGSSSGFRYQNDRFKPQRRQSPPASRPDKKPLGRFVYFGWKSFQWLLAGRSHCCALGLPGAVKEECCEPLNRGT